MEFNTSKKITQEWKINVSLGVTLMILLREPRVIIEFTEFWREARRSEYHETFHLDVPPFHLVLTLTFFILIILIPLLASLTNNRIFLIASVIYIIFAIYITRMLILDDIFAKSYFIHMIGKVTPVIKPKTKEGLSYVILRTVGYHYGEGFWLAIISSIILH